MQVAEDLKQRGNTCFANGDVNGAEAAYLQAIKVLTNRQEHQQEQEQEKEQQEYKEKVSSIDNATRQLLATLYSNLSNVYHAQGSYEKSWEAARKATDCESTFAKAWLRYIHARRLSGYPFEAFVTLLRYFRPLLRNQNMSSSSVLNLGDISEEVEVPLFRDLGLSNVSSYIELQDYKGGVGIVARRAIKPNEVILVEKRFETSFVDADLSSQGDLTTQKIVEYFAKKIYPHQRDHSQEWERFKKEFKGCWPRCPEDISNETREEMIHALRVQFPDIDESDFEDLFSFAVMCRYNCFHSGFFRACALANHSCLANAAMKFNPQDNTVTLIAVRPINPGDFINVKYFNDAHFLMGVGKRREHLRSWLFWCACERCCMDNNSDAKEEYVQCSNCQKYTHLPLVSATISINEKDPLLLSEKPCNNCGEIQTWSPERQMMVSRLVLSFSKITTSMRYQEVAEWLLVKLRQVAEFHVHHVHWLYRVLFYFFCVPVTSIVNKTFETFTKLGWQTSQIEDLLREYGIRPLYMQAVYDSTNKTLSQERKERKQGQDTDRTLSTHNTSDNNNNNIALNTTVTDRATDKLSPEEVEGVVAVNDIGAAGGDVLYILCVLWRLISPFYPPYEGWALHRAICQLVLFAHTRPNEMAAMPAAEAAGLLRLHGRYLGAAEISMWMHAYNMHKPTAQRKGLLTSKQIKKAFQP
ncbi:SET domain [Trypanosoma melophagium]|uniref:SET domain n=1 Tax=Trypanosoma melophagium TaxID=715481 RepID=UPI00351A57F8|nr:SET domain [Trypanosoma melophagium]